MTAVLGYSNKWKNKSMIKRAMSGKLRPTDTFKILDRKNPAIDLISHSPWGSPWGTPEEIRKATGKTNIAFTNKRRSFYGQFIYNEKTKKWSVK